MAEARPGMLSPSATLALDWAAAAAALRQGGSSSPVPAGVPDLLVGLLLAHPDPDGEASVLLAHFDLTARDVLPPWYPAIAGDTLQRWADELDPSTSGGQLPELSEVLEDAASRIGSGPVRLADVLGAVLRGSSHELWTPMRDAFDTVGVPLELVSRAYDEWLAAIEVEPPRVAGVALAAELERAFPRAPVELPTYASDGTSGRDLINIRREVDAFAYLLASRDLTPPLAVGLFGNWGSGKSFMMDSIRRRIEAITEEVADEPQVDVRFWKQVNQVRFNAWQYVQGNLWASLLEHIFAELGQVERDELEQRRATASAELEEARDERRVRREARESAAEAVAAMTGELEVVERRRARGVMAADAEAEERLRALREEAGTSLDDVRETAAHALRDAWPEGAAPEVGDDVTDLLEALRVTREQVGRGRALLGPYWDEEATRRATWAALGVFVGTVALAALLSVLDLPAMLSGVGAVAAAVPLVTRLLRSANSWASTRLGRIEEAERAIEAELDRQRRALDDSVTEARRRLELARSELRVAMDAERAAEAEAAAVEQRFAGLTPGRVLGDFLAERSRSDDYRRHLGIVRMVNDDLRRLESLVRRHNRATLATGGGDPSPASQTDDGSPIATTNRIILYIDDLDRCPDEKVVEVLEAVHLLLAFELFVVVVAVDTRWLRHALTEQLPALADPVHAPPAPATGSRAGDHRATPQDYLEKIFQLPFWVQPLADPGRAALVRGLLEGSVERPGGDDGEDAPTSSLVVGDREASTIDRMLERRGGDPRREARQLTVTRDDLTFLESLAPLLGDTPRGVKRFVNVVQLLSILLGPGVDEGDPTNRRLAAFLAAVRDGCPAVGEVLFDRVLAGPASTIGAVVDTQDWSDPDVGRVRTWLDANPAWRSVPTSRLEPLVPLVRRVSFEELD